ncbi:helix-turn-helix transcriptional regulator [Aureimonas sp. OT7]|uniref:AraC family transcriptional regulator n=1 Tax=Aureimonas sp. OT7 TaxID=2816454 RepID=UPI001783388D|nr:helix-turn-helix transcriptional regulator [Aureimonas sp. OT7]QOG05048.1 helix-turn-helix transcriptional regulator [Aureimonas sp. OT7]
MREIHIDTIDITPRSIVAIAKRYPSGHYIEPYEHRRGQFMTAGRGGILLTTPEGAWLMPPERGMWIPPGTVHNVRMIGIVEMHSLYIDANAAPDMPGTCQVVGLSSFMRTLMMEAVDCPLGYDLEGRDGALMELILHEVRCMPALPLSLPYPSHEALATRCQAFISEPSISETIDDWCAELAMSRRTFTRLFRAQTGLSFAAWRQQACLMSAMTKLVAGASVTSVAGELGYDNPAAFTTMFKRAFGAPPLAYLRVRASARQAA